MSLRISGGRRLQSPPGATARPTPARVRLAVMNLLAGELAGSRWLDLCCGSGAMACEALQRGAAEVVAVDRDRRMVAVARANLEAVAAGTAEGRCDVACREVLRWLEQGRGVRQRFDLIYADPPYAAGLYGPLAERVLAGDWLAAEGTLLLECASDGVPELPVGWELRDRRRYGGTTVLLLSPRGRCPGGTGSTLPRTDRPE